MKAIRTAFDISDDKDIRIWNKYMSSTYELLKDPDLTIQDSELYDGQVGVHLSCIKIKVCNELSISFLPIVSFKFQSISHQINLLLYCNFLGNSLFKK